MSWATLILTLLKLAASLAGWAKEKQLLDAGRDKEIARASLAVLEATVAGRQLRDRIVAMDDPEAEALWQRMLQP